MAVREEKSYCRICSGVCGVVISIEDDRIVGIRGDKDHPLTRGYACIKGLQAVEAHYGQQRLLQPQKRNPDGSFSAIPLEQALDEIAAKLSGILERDGPEAIAAYRGTIGFYNSGASRIMQDWLACLGSHGFYTTMTIDQSAKYVTVERLGLWGGGTQSLRDADVWLLAGNNPLVSIAGSGLSSNPTLSIKEAKARGTKFIVIDPRRTETARHADLFLQILPGEDPTVAAGLLRIILTEGWEDKAFCARYVNNLEGLRAAIEPYTPDYVARRAGISTAQLREAAELFARIGKRGAANAATGPCMAAHSNLSDHLYACLNVVCGRFPREGERVDNPGVMSRYPARAEVWPPRRSWESGIKSRIRDTGMLFGEKMTGILADEILTPGAGQVKSLFVLGGNPVSAIPDQRKVVEAMKALELLVTIDPYMSTTARLAHYVLPPRLFYEQANLGPVDFETAIFPQPFAAYTPAIVPPPPGSDVVEDWTVFWALAKRLGRTIRINGVALDMEQQPSAEDLYNIMLKNGPVSFDEIRKHRGQVLDLPPVFVEPAPESTGRFEVAPPDVVAELAEVLREAPPTGYTHRLSSRRTREVSNTMYHDFPAIRHRVPYNPAYLNPADLASLGLSGGERIEVVSDHGRIPAIVEADADVRQGVISMSHGWGALPGENADYAEVGASTSLLVSTDRNMDPINAMPRMSAIPVRIERPR